MRHDHAALGLELEPRALLGGEFPPQRDAAQRQRQAGAGQVIRHQDVALARGGRPGERAAAVNHAHPAPGGGQGRGRSGAHHPGADDHGIRGGGQRGGGSHPFSQPLTPAGKEDGEPLLAIDKLGAGAAQLVILSNDGAGARELVGVKNSPVRWMVLGVCD